MFLFDLIECQPLKLAMIEFTDLVFDQHGEMMGKTNEMGGMPRPLKIARIDRINDLAAQMRRNLFCLAHTHLV